MSLWTLFKAFNKQHLPFRPKGERGQDKRK